MCHKVVPRPVSPAADSKVPLAEFFAQLKKLAFEVHQYQKQNPNLNVFVKSAVERPPLIIGGRASNNMLRTRTRSDTFEDTINATHSKSEAPLAHN